MREKKEAHSTKDERAFDRRKDIFCISVRESEEGGADTGRTEDRWWAQGGLPTGLLSKCLQVSNTLGVRLGPRTCLFSI